ncbi:hypothetical protein SVI_2395 [Shewanella violacea DSS12]|uniref:Uncharacterized protein n=1 Tax=Shewanella violacea (strain JCM 10179 / CIP 106290 / LMG 19151 / DSS12) TaxID=637905 RepID=D4ZL17_SHEVD|nr:hypothetical protein SVI_2395 [Shewanella violacea DSS12]
MINILMAHFDGEIDQNERYRSLTRNKPEGSLTNSEISPKVI